MAMFGNALQSVCVSIPIQDGTDKYPASESTTEYGYHSEQKGQKHYYDSKRPINTRTSEGSISS